MNEFVCGVPSKGSCLFKVATDVLIFMHGLANNKDVQCICFNTRGR